MKKTLCLCFALALALSLLGAPAFAADTGDISSRVTITKHPTGETVDEGDTAYFVATADNATAIIWRIVSNDTTNTIQAANASDYFDGLIVAGLGTETLVLMNIPASMDGWRVEAMFEGPGGPVYSNGALIRINGVQLKTPTIAAQPQGASLESGETTTLSVSAATTTGSLRFQWYANSANTNLGGTAIEGATGASYVPEEVTGTTYYYVEVRSAENGRESEPAVSNAVAVSYAAPAQDPDPAAQETETPETQETQAPLVPVVDTPEDNSGDGDTASAPRNDGSQSAGTSVQRASNALSMLTVVGGVLAVAALAGGITALVLRFRGDDEDEDEDE